MGIVLAAGLPPLPAFLAAAQTSPCYWILDRDVNADRIVDGSDVVLMWTAQGDLNQDGVADGSDVLLLMQGWGEIDPLVEVRVTGAYAVEAVYPEGVTPVGDDLWEPQGSENVWGKVMAMESGWPAFTGVAMSAPTPPLSVTAVCS